MTERDAIRRIYLLWCELVDRDAEWWSTHPKTLAGLVGRARSDEDQIEELIEAFLAAHTDAALGRPSRPPR